MAILTALPLDEARRIGALYELDVAAVRGIPAGSVNSNYELTLAGGGRVFLRIYEEQTLASAALEARLLDHLAAGGVKTPKPLIRVDQGEGSTTPTGQRGDQGFIAELAGKPVALFPWVPGEILCQRAVTPESARRVGEALARVHIAGASFEGAPKSRFGAEQLEARLASLAQTPLPEHIARDAAELSRRLALCPPRAPESVAVIHGDLFRDNVLWDQGEITALLDFESASRGSAAFDLGVTLLSWCYADSLDQALCRALAQGYSSARPLSPGERESLFDETVFAALRFSVTRITDFELRPKGSGIYKDYRRFLGRLGELSRMGREGFLTFLSL
jgi:homoserine kinase type II